MITKLNQLNTLILLVILSISAHNVYFADMQTMTNNTLANFNNTQQDLNLNVLNNSFSIVTTLSFVADFVQNIVGNLFQVTSIVRGTEDPHSFSPKPTDISAIQSANVFVVFGIADIDGWAQTIIDSPPPNLKIIKLVNLQQDGIFDPFLGQNGGLNPHLWMSPNFVNSTILQRIYENLVKIDPIHQSTYQMNLEVYRNKLSLLINQMDANATILRKNKVVIVEYHPAFFYLFRDMNLTRIGTIEKVENQEPSALHITEITNLIKEQQKKGFIVYLVQAMNLSNSTTLQIARDTGAKFVYMAALLGKYPGINFTSYIQMLNFDLNALNHPVTIKSENYLSVNIFYIIIPTIFLLITLILIKIKQYKTRISPL